MHVFGIGQISHTLSNAENVNLAGGPSTARPIRIVPIARQTYPVQVDYGSSYLFTRFSS